MMDILKIPEDQIQIKMNTEKFNSCETNSKNFEFFNPPQNELPFAILNNQFYIIKKLGKGSTGSVFLSYPIEEQFNPKSFYAIKIIPQKDNNFDGINLCEVNYLERLDHKNILKIYGHGIGQLQYQNGFYQQVYYIIMDYLNHGSLLEQIHDNIGLGEDYARLIFLQLLDGLEAIHNSNIVHRDIKLENIMLSGNDYTLKYIDFGFATEKSNGYLNTFLGTPNYAAPELYFKQPYLGVSEDIFSLGVTLFIIVTGHLPFLCSAPNDILYKYIFYGDYGGYWKKRNMKLSQSFKELFNNLVAFEPSQRPSISEIRESQWMKEINFDIKNDLINEFIKREQISIIENQKIMMMNINNEKSRVDDILDKIKEKKRIDVENDIKGHLFSINNNNKNKENDIKEETEEKNKNSIKNKNNNLNGFIHMNLTTKKLSSLIFVLKKFFKSEGYNTIKKDLVNLKMEITNGEIDVILSLEKMYKIIKVSYRIINGSTEDFINFKKIMKKMNIKEE